MSELRGLGLVADGLLWVLSGGKKASEILAFTGGGDSYTYAATVATYSPDSALLHPFDFTFDDAGNAYVSNQDTNVVARLDVASTRRSATPAADASALPAGSYLPGTFVASAVGIPVGVTTVDPPTALEVTIVEGKASNSVRGVAWADGLLYVADEVAGVVKTYDSDGAFQGQSNVVGSPVHLLVTGDALLVTNGTDVLADGLTEAPELKKLKAIDVPTPSGLALDAGGNLYVASRKGKAIYTYANFPDGPTPVQSAPCWCTARPA